MYYDYGIRSPKPYRDGLLDLVPLKPSFLRPSGLLEQCSFMASERG